MDELKQDDQLKLTYNSFVPIQDVALKTYQKRWMIERGGGRGPRIFMHIARHDDDDDDDIKANTDNTQLNRKGRLCRDKDEKVNHIISEFSKLVQKEYKTGNEWVGKWIHWESGRLKFDHTLKRYTYKPESVPKEWDA